MSNINNLLAALADELNSISQRNVPDAKEVARKIPLRSLSGDHIIGGMIQNFSSTGIKDTALNEQLSVSNDGVTVKSFVNGFKASGTVELEDAVVKVLKAEVVQADTIVGTVEYANDTPFVFKNKNLDGLGLLWQGETGNTKQFVFNSNTNSIFVSENIDLARGKSITVNGIPAINEKELGPTVTKSNLREVGRLNGLIVDGSLAIGQYLFYSNDTNRLGLGIEDPNGAFSVAEDGIELVMGTKDGVRGYFGTHGSNNLDILTDNVERLSITSSGNITLGNPRLAPVQVSVHGKLAIKVAVPDPEVDLHVNGSIKFNNRIHKYDRNAPTGGAYNEGDIVWNIEPKMSSYVGWVCIQAGAPGIWAPFGKIGS